MCVFWVVFLFGFFNDMQVQVVWAAMFVVEESISSRFTNWGGTENLTLILSI